MHWMQHPGLGAFVVAVAGGIAASSALGAPGDIYPLGLEYGSRFAEAINNAGQVVVFADTKSYVSIGTPGVDGQLHELASPNGTDWIIHVYAISNAGHIVGSNKSPYGGIPSYAFLYTGTPGVDGQMINLNPFGRDDSYATDVNDLGQVVGVFWNSQNEPRAFQYSGGQFYDLGTLGGAEARASGINNAGQIVGGAYNANGRERGPSSTPVRRATAVRCRVSAHSADRKAQPRRLTMPDRSSAKLKPAMESIRLSSTPTARCTTSEALATRTARVSPMTSTRMATSWGPASWGRMTAGQGGRFCIPERPALMVR